MAALERARSASSLDLLKAFSAYSYERYLGLGTRIPIVRVHRVDINFY